MLILNPSNSDLTEAMLVSDSFAELMRADATGITGGGRGAALLVWKGGFRSKELDAHFARPSWPLELLEALPPSARWPWKLDVAGAEVCDPAAIFAAVERASGANRSPKTNVHVKLELRAYQERGNSEGGARWWREREAICATNAFGRAFHDVLTTFFELSGQAGSALYTEQISVILSKDEAVPVATLTPTLHSDSFYARRETAIVSLLEKGWDMSGGTHFLPLRNMAELWDRRPITMETLRTQMVGECAVVAGHGDVMIYDGMIGPDGSAERSRGVPHISPDQPGRASRLCLLMHHERPAREAGKEP
jgi:hypothetical protein